MASLFTDIVGQRPEEIESRSIDSLQWFQTNVRDIRRVPSSLLKENQNFVTRFELGKMYMFMYDAKTKDKLKYYDYFPITICLKRYSTGFMGVNLHYLSPKYRALLMDGLYEFYREIEDESYFQIKYPTIKSVSKLRWAKPCIKQYQYSYIDSRIVEVRPEHMDMAVMLPSQRFISKGTTTNANDIYRKSIRKV
tara:strand:+ start:2561 stop:3142 length:582 start_codon:yes stop_codon:yes gene_type:complete